MHVLITGGAGFIGSHTARALMDDGHRVRLLDSLKPPVHKDGKPFNMAEGAKLVKGDVTCKEDMVKALKGVDAVIHLAAYQDYLPDFSTFFTVNAAGTALLYEIIVEKDLPIQKVVVASSQAAYGEGKYRSKSGEVFYPDIRSVEALEQGGFEIVGSDGEVAESLVTDEAVINPQNQYAMSKYTQEMIALNLGRRYGIPSVAMRYSIVQGPGQSLYNAYSGACRVFCLSLHFDHRPPVYEDGMQLRDYVNVEDVVRANVLVLEKDEPNYRAFNVGGGKAYTVLDFARLAAEVYGKDLEPELTGAFRFGDTRHIVSDISALQSLGWEPQHTPHKSVRDYKAWLEDMDNVDDVLAFAQERMKSLNVVRAVKK
ncbi:MAG: NAD-dependent epimerase/dehydratase family protein [Candidatus Latescibacteria bacterium]|nr:NAD-dependent epimerase/dehydratase family protein [Candidatus Latescibacterota bacterium]